MGGDAAYVGAEYTTDYAGKHVALTGFEPDAEIVGVGDRIADALAQAREKGCDDPVLAFIPTKETICLF